MSDTPIARLRKRHKASNPNRCAMCAQPWPCDIIAALDVLEVEGRDIQFRMFELQTRLDAATELIRQAMKERHYSIHPLGTSIDTCPHCAPFREWLAGDKEDGSE